MTRPLQPTATDAPPQTETGIREDLLHPDPLLDCLVELTRIYGRPSTRAALSAGLPLPKEGLTPSLFARAASARFAFPARWCAARCARSTAPCCP
ncbi:hypothetical protein LP420_04970 [Massilia sp. B-10]|nr:hypothetical protein LP420_04970 [Massilia sp. B-10]